VWDWLIWVGQRERRLAVLLAGWGFWLGGVGDVGRERPGGVKTGIGLASEVVHDHTYAGLVTLSKF